MAVTLGGFPFKFMEIPEEIPFSGGKHLMVHKLIGGDRVLDDMGDDPDPIEWTGVFLGGDAADRARELDAMKQEGGEYLLTWGPFARQVVIRHFKPRYHFQYRVSYSICVEVVPTRPGGISSIGDMVAGDFGALGDLAGNVLGGPLGDIVGAALDGPLGDIIDTAQTAIGIAADVAETGQFIAAPIAALLGASSTVSGVASAVSGALDLADAAFPELGLDTLSGLSPTDAAGTLLDMVDNTGTLSTVATAAGYIGRIAGNVALYGG